MNAKNPHPNGGKERINRTLVRRDRRKGFNFTSRGNETFKI
jgi:hypothetical protein